MISAGGSDSGQVKSIKSGQDSKWQADSLFESKCSLPELASAIMSRFPGSTETPDDCIICVELLGNGQSRQTKHCFKSLQVSLGPKSKESQSHSG